MNIKHSDPHSISALQSIAKASLEANIVELASGSYLTAGRNQFKTLWTRDFALSVRGLILIGRADVAKSHLSKLIENRRRSDGLVPRVMDTSDVALRVVRPFLNRVIPSFLRFYDPDPPIQDPLKPEFRDEHGTEAIDSNLLVLLASLQYAESSDDEGWWKKNEEALKQIFRFYDSKIQDGWIQQGAFADWQDSVRREGICLWSNLLYQVVAEKLQERGWSFPLGFLEKRRISLRETFLDPSLGLFRAMKGHPYISIDGNLLAIDLGFYPSGSNEAQELYQALKRHPIWKGSADLPGQATSTAYPSSWKSFAVRMVGLRNYHEDIYWSWLMALAGKVSFLMGDRDEGERIAVRIEEIMKRDGHVTEIFSPDSDLPPWGSWAFKAERPFSWGAAFTVDLISTRSAKIKA